MDARPGTPRILVSATLAVLVDGVPALDARDPDLLAVLDAIPSAELRAIAQRSGPAAVDVVSRAAEWKGVQKLSRYRPS